MLRYIQGVMPLLIVAFICLLAPVFSSASMDCVEFVGRVVGQSAVPSSHKINSFDDLLTAFTQGLEPDLSDADQRTAFRIYRKLRFGNPKTSLSQGSSQRIAETLGRYPELQEQQRFRNYRVRAQERDYPVTSEFAQFLSTQFKSIGQVKSNLLQVDANQGYWKKVLGYQLPDEFKIMPQDKSARKELQKAAREHASSFLEQRFPQELREMLRDKKRPIKERSSKLYQFMVEERKQMTDRGESVDTISQAIVDTVSSIGYHDSSLQKALKATDGMEALRAFRQILSERDSFAMELGFEGHFKQVLKDFDIAFPTGLAEEKRLPSLLESFEKGIVENARVLGAGQERTIRHLSLAESPFRSCLGGSDCSSRTYPTRALDPNYHYFTLTDGKGYSSGHITVVLGTAKSKRKEIKVAFIDKVQNVENMDIPFMMEGMRRSVEEKGYRLALPKDVGDHNGISNEQMTRDFIAKNIATNEKEKLTAFTPHPHSYQLDSGYSRAENKLTLYHVMPWGSPDIELSATDITTPWHSPDINLKQLAQGSIALKNGSTEDRIRYIESMVVLEKMGVKTDPQFAQTLARWLGDSSTDLPLRKQVLLFEWQTNEKPLTQLLSSFAVPERTTILQNLLDTPRYKKRISQNTEQLHQLVILVRHSKTLRAALLGEILSGHSDSNQALALSSKVFSAKDIPNKKALEILTKIDQELDFTRIEKVLELAQLLKGTSAEESFGQEITVQWIKQIESDATVARRLFRYLNVPLVQRIILTGQSDTSSDLLTLYRNLLDKQAQSGKDLRDIVEEWLVLPQDAPLKGELLLSQVGEGTIFKRYLELIPENQHDALWEKIDAESSLSVHLKFARKNKMEERLLARAVFESFEFREITMPNGHRFEIQRTPETQIKWEAVMGENPSHFKGDNHPVEQVSWHDAQEYIAKLNKSLGLKGCDGTPKSPQGCYRLPTEEEWEYALQKGAETTYFFGDDESLLSKYAWFGGNAGDKTHPVGLKRENPHGLFDMHGNVWEWMQDPWSNNVQRWIDHLRSSPRSSRVIRGGGWRINAQYLRSAFRNYGYPGYGYLDVGFRLVRTR